nr:ATP-binding protein [Sphingomonas gilva]
MRGFWPKSLVGQIALLVAIALFVAQAINFALLLQGGRSLRQAQITGPSVARLVSAVERDREGGIAARNRAIRLMSANPIPSNAERLGEVEAAVARGFVEAGRPVPPTFAAIRQVERGSFDRPLDRHERRILRAGSQLLIAAESAPGRWVVVSAPWPGMDRGMIWRLIAQTVIIYVLVLGAVYWIGRRIARPLAELGSAAHAFTPADPGPPVAESGPEDVRSLIAAFNALRLRVVAMLDEKDRMLGAIGHDLRTPLAALRVRIESVEDEADRAKMADTIDEMNRMLEDILSLARIGRGSEPAVETELTALVDVVVEDFRDLGADVRFEPEGRIVRRVRSAAMKRAVRNLIENAVKYAGAAEVTVTQEADAVRIAVEDRGPGIPPDKLAHVFDAFTRLETSRNRDTGGIGLGLALARAIAAEAGGALALANRAGGGLSAVITLP